MSSHSEDIGFDWWFEGANAPVTAEPLSAPVEVVSPTAQAMETVTSAMRTALDLQKLINQRGRRSANASKCLMMVDEFFIGLQDMKQKIERISSGDASAANEIPGLLEAFRESLDFNRLLSGMKGYRKGGENALAEYIGITVDTLSNEFAQVSDAVRPLSDRAAIESVSQQVRDQLSAVTGYKFHGKTPVLVMAEKPVAAIVAKPVPAVTPAPVAIPVIERASVNVPKTPEAAPGFLEKAASYLDALRAGFGGSARRLVPALATGLVLALGGCAPEADDDNGGAKRPPPPRKVIVVPDPAPTPAPKPAPAPEPAPAEPIFTVDSSAPTLWHAIRGAIKTSCGLEGGALERATGERVRTSFEQQQTGFGQRVDTMEAGDHDASRLAAVQTDLRGYGITVPITYDGVRNDGIHSIGNVGAYTMDGTTIVSYATAALSGYTCPSK